MFSFIKKARWPYLREKVLRRDNYTCQYCGSITDLSVDHIWPRSKGGKNELCNLITACKSCNSSKNGRTLREWIEYKNGPIVPPTSLRIITIHEDKSESFSELSIPYLDILQELAPKLVSGEITFTVFGSGLSRTAFTLLRDCMINNNFAVLKSQKSVNQGVLITKLGWRVIRQLAGISDEINESDSIPILSLQEDDEKEEEIISVQEDPIVNEIKPYIRDALYEQSLEIIHIAGRASISLLQRKLRIGYTRAGRIIDELEANGVIGKSEGGGKYRQLLSGDNPTGF